MNDARLPRAIDDAAAVRDLHPLMAQLRPHLVDADAFVARWARQHDEGYRIVALYEAQRPVALAGYRVQHNLVHGRFLYVDDLVTDFACRGCGHGERLLRHLELQARAQGCAKLVLDTPMSNALGQRFYFRCGLLATALRFVKPLEAPVGGRSLGAG